jgi:predicted DNA binding CopG/RHH family protein
MFKQLYKELIMANTDRFHASIEAWESGALGRDEKHVKQADASAEAALDDAMEMQMISIRLQKKLIEDLKSIAKHNGIGYQPLIRQLLTRFVISEFKQMINDAIAEKRLKSNQLQKEIEHKKVKVA